MNKIVPENSLYQHRLALRGTLHSDQSLRAKLSSRSLFPSNLTIFVHVSRKTKTKILILLGVNMTSLSKQLQDLFLAIFTYKNI